MPTLRLAGALLLLLPAAAQANFPGSNGRIAFSLRTDEASAEETVEPLTISWQPRP